MNYRETFAYAKVCAAESPGVWKSNVEIVEAYPAIFSGQNRISGECLYTPSWEKLLLFVKIELSGEAQESFIPLIFFLILDGTSRFSLLFVFSWISTRYFKLYSNNVLNAREVEVEYFTEWIYSVAGGLPISFFVAEPLVILLKFSLIPMVLDKFERDIYDDNLWFQLTISSGKVKKVQNSKTVSFLEYIADILESI
eukprot:snap_masked-scaffold_42-processed-gene-2.26-mRNA-1 protein AED:1.00 eAED:1.00 QI:0/0/0/0/1/1/3/0/196